MTRERWLSQFTFRNHHIKGSPINALIRPSIQGDQLIVHCDAVRGAFQCPLVLDTTRLSNLEVVMHKSKATPWAYDVGSAAETWFTQACGVPTKLVYLPPQSYRPVLGNVSADFKQDKGITFSDCASYLVTSGSSLRAVNEMLDDAAFDVKPLRPNMVVDSRNDQLVPWDEDYWRALEVGEDSARFETTSNCARCSSIDIEFVKANHLALDSR